MTEFLLVHGAWHGGWCWNLVVDRLAARGHRAIAPTLTGLAERSHLLSPDVGLSVHIADVVNLAYWAELSDFVLVGHSYGGMVITGAAEALAGRLAGIAYVDALYPADGQSTSDLVGPLFASTFAPVIDPPPVEVFAIANAAERARVARLMTPHPAKSAAEPVRLTGAIDAVQRKTYIVADHLPGATPFKATGERLAQDPRWRTETLPTGHHPMIDAPDALTDLLVATAG